MSWYSIDCLGIQKNPYQNSNFQFFTKKVKEGEQTNIETKAPKKQKKSVPQKKNTSPKNSNKKQPASKKKRPTLRKTKTEKKKTIKKKVTKANFI